MLVSDIERKSLYRKGLCTGRFSDNLSPEAWWQGGIFIKVANIIVYCHSCLMVEKKEKIVKKAAHVRRKQICQYHFSVS